MLETKEIKKRDTTNDRWRKLVAQSYEAYNNAKTQFEAFADELGPQHFISQYLAPAECMRDYTFNKSVGAGARGDVFEACKMAGDCGYVVKLFPLNSYRDQDEFFNEVKITTVMGNLHIGPKVIDFWVCTSPIFNLNIWHDEFKVTPETLMYPGEKLLRQHIESPDPDPANRRIAIDWRFNFGDEPAVVNRYLVMRKYGIMILQKLHQSFEDWVEENKSNPDFEDDAKQLLVSLEQKLRRMYDTTGYLHVDADPNNNVMINEVDNDIYLIDFGEEGISRINNDEEAQRMIDRTMNRFNQEIRVKSMRK